MPLLEADQLELLQHLVQAARSLSREDRQPFFVARTFGGDSIIHPGLPDGELEWYFGDVEILARSGLLNLRYGDSPSFDVTPEGFLLIEKEGKRAQDEPSVAAQTRYALAAPRAAVIKARNMFARGGMNSREVVEFFCAYSDDIPDYPWNPGLAYRAEYFDRCLELLDPKSQVRALLDLCDYTGPAQYGLPSDEERTALRALLMGAPTPVEFSETLNIDWPLVITEWTKCLKRLHEDQEAAITSARTMLEAVCKHICNARHVEYSNDGDLVRLYKKTAEALNLAPETAQDALRQILGGCAGISSGIAGLRNALGDSHGRDQEHTAAEVRHARLAINAAGTLATFLIESHSQAR